MPLIFNITTNSNKLWTVECVLNIFKLSVKNKCAKKTQNKKYLLHIYLNTENIGDCNCSCMPDKPKTNS